MADQKKIELTSRQQDLLLQGLRYIRSSVKLTREEPTPESVQKRDEQLKELSLLSSIIEGSSQAEMVLQS